MGIEGSFARAQAEYASHNIPLFPVRIENGDKKPLVRNYLRAGLQYSRNMVEQFPDATAFGFALGPRTGITVLDVDSSDERVLARALERHGQTPIIVRSVSNHYQGWYAHAGEKRRIRPDKTIPIDLLGAGFVVAPPSQGQQGSYQFVSGSLDDIGRLPKLRNSPPGWSNTTTRNSQLVNQGSRNDSLWRHCMSQARNCDDLETLLDVGRGFNEQCHPPLDDSEVIRTVNSAWRATASGRNWFGKSHEAFSRDDMSKLLLELDGDPRVGQDAWSLFGLLTLRHRGHPCFTVPNEETGSALRWHRARVRGARNHLIRSGLIHQISPAAQQAPAVYGWGPQAPCTPQEDSVLYLKVDIFDHPGRPAGEAH